MSGDIQTTETPGQANGQAGMSIEDRARMHGWHPQEEFRGDPKAWVPAEVFVERMENQTPILRQRMKTLEDKYGRTEAELQAMRRQVSEGTTVITEMRDMLSKSEQRGYARAEAELKARMQEAVKTADEEGYNRAQAELDALRTKREETKTPPATTTQVQTAPPALNETQTYVRDWIEAPERAWYRSDKELEGIADGLHGAFRAKYPNETIQENLARVEGRVRELYPDRFNQKPRPTVPDVSTPSSPTGIIRGKTGRTFQDLPDDAKASYERMARQIERTTPNKPFTKEEYLASYVWDDQ